MIDSMTDDWLLTACWARSAEDELDLQRCLAATFEFTNEIVCVHLPQINGQ